MSSSPRRAAGLRRAGRGLRAGALGLVLVLAGSGARAGTDAVRHLELTNLHTGEVLAVEFASAGPIASQTLAKLNHLLRDFRVNEEHPMDARLFGLLADLADAAHCEARFEVISGYRSARTNSQLHAAGHGVAEHSQHMEGRAMDVRLKGCALERLRDAALAARAGGVGYYPRSNFVHVDTGRVRTWQE